MLTEDDIDEAVLEYVAKLEYDAGYSRRQADRFGVLYRRLVREVDACGECRPPYRMCETHRELRGIVEASLDWRVYENGPEVRD